MSAETRPGNPPAPAGRVELAGIGDEAARDLAGQLAAITRLGWNAIELRSVDGVALADLDDDAFAAVAGTLAETGTRVVAVDSRIGGWSRPATEPFVEDLVELDVLAERCAALGTRYVRVMSYPNDALPDDEWERRVLARLGVLAARAERAGLVLLHENCAGWAGASAERAVRLVRTVDNPAFGLLFDTGNGVPYDYDAYDLLAGVVEYVRHVHVKDVAGTGADHAYRLPGRGTARVADCLRLLMDHGYTGALSIEPHLGYVPHEGRRAPDEECAALFVAAGEALSALLDEVGGGGPREAGGSPR